MGCGCGNSTNIDGYQTTKNKAETQIDLTGKMVLDNHGNQLLVLSPIYDAYRDVIGYSVKTLDQRTLRIFARDVQKVLD